jgi:copper transport protein
MITLVELGAVFWVGAQFWVIYVLRPSAEDHPKLSASNQQVQQRFERRFSLPLLLVLLLANIGVLLGQALDITGGNVAAASGAGARSRAGQRNWPDAIDRSVA